MSSDKVDRVGEDYLKRLAQSVIAKERRAAADPPSTTPPPIPSAIPSSRPSVSSDQVRRPNLAPAAPPPALAPMPTPLPAMAPRTFGPETTWKKEIPVTGPNGDYLAGTILYFEDTSIGVFKGRHKNKDYDLVYMLGADGRVTPQGIPLVSYDTRPIGRLAPTYLDQLTSRLKWDRDLVVFHLLDYEDRLLVPHVVRTSSSDDNVRVSQVVAKLPPSATETTSSPHTRGRRLTVAFGKDRLWEAVYWGKDELGHVVAHKTHENWALMHLDLNRFKDTVTYGQMLSGDEIREVELDILRNQSA